MIDDPEKTQRLMAELEASLPLEVAVQQHVRAAISAQSPDIVIPERCKVTKLFYLDEEGGITCGLDVGQPDSGTPLILSITYLFFDKRSPLFRQIDAYQRHRIKKLKKQAGRVF